MAARRDKRERDLADHEGDAIQFIELLAKKIEVPESLNELSKGTLLHHLRGVLSALPKGGLRRQLKKHVEPYSERLYEMCETCDTDLPCSESDSCRDRVAAKIASHKQKKPKVVPASAKACRTSFFETV
jgi:hypothetical protein